MDDGRISDLFMEREGHRQYLGNIYKGRIVKSSGKELALQLEEKGYDWIKEEA